MGIENIIHDLHDISERYELKILYLDFTDITLPSRIGLSQEVFIQICANVNKQKTNLSLIVAGDRVYGVDKEGGFYHEHYLCQLMRFNQKDEEEFRCDALKEKDVM